MWGRSFPRREVRLYDGDRCVSRIHTKHYPRAACYVPVESHTPAVMVAEGNQFSVWDLSRTPKPIASQSFSQQTLFAVTSGKGFVATAGMDRAINVISPKKWRLVGSWKGALKYVDP